MAINYKYTFGSASAAVCNPQPISGTSVVHEMELQDCLMCPVGITSLGRGANNFLGNNDFKVISDFWMDNVIDIGFLTTASTTVPANNLERFYASNLPTPDCSVYSENDIMLQRFSLSSDGVYTVFAPINNSTSQAYPAGKLLNVKVIASFKNGEMISEKRCITLAHPSQQISVQIRGDIKDFEYGVTNYEITIYN
jgi:hypothetical protein